MLRSCCEGDDTLKRFRNYLVMKILRRRTFTRVCTHLLTWWTIWSVSAAVCVQAWGDDAAQQGTAYWRRLNRTADHCFRGLDIDLEVSGGYSRLYDEDESQPVAKVALKMPLYNASERINRRERKMQYLEQGAKVISRYEAAQAKIELLKEEARVCEKVMMQQGLEGIEKYFQIRERMADVIAEKQAAMRTLEGLLSGCE